MTTTARALAGQVYHEWKINNYKAYILDQRDTDRLLDIVAKAISDSETRGRESVLSRVPSESIISYAAATSEAIADKNNETWNYPICFVKGAQYIIAKLKEPANVR